MKTRTIMIREEKYRLLLYVARKLGLNLHETLREILNYYIKHREA